MGETETKSAILVIDRDATTLEIVQNATAEMEVHVASSVDLALRIAARRPPSIAVIDALVAGPHPAEVYVKLRMVAPGMRALFLAPQNYELDRRCGQVGQVLRKPLTAKRFADALLYAQRLRNMTEGVQRMRGSSGTFPAVRPVEPTVFEKSTTSGSTPPASGTGRIQGDLSKPVSSVPPASGVVGEGDASGPTSTRSPYFRGK